MEMDCGVVVRHMLPASLFAAPTGATHRACRQVAQMAMQTVWSAVDDPVGGDLSAEVPPRQAFGLAGLDRGAAFVDAAEDRGVFQPPVEKAAARVLVWSGLRRRRGTERQLQGMT